MTMNFIAVDLCVDEDGNVGLWVEGSEIVNDIETGKAVYRLSLSLPVPSAVESVEVEPGQSVQVKVS